MALPPDPSLATLSAPIRDAYLADLGLAQDAARAAKVPSRVTAEDNTWLVWRDFCLEHTVDPLLATVTDPIPYLQVFGQRYRDGRLAKDGKPVYARTVEDALRQIGQTMASLGAKDHRLIGPKQIDFRLSRQIAGYKTTDPAPNRVKPVPMGLLRDLHTAARTNNDVFALAVADMAIIALYYLCRPGEYAATTQATRSSPFTQLFFPFGRCRMLCPPRRLPRFPCRPPSASTLTVHGPGFHYTEKWGFGRKSGTWPVHGTFCLPCLGNLSSGPSLALLPRCTRHTSVSDFLQRCLETCQIV